MLESWREHRPAIHPEAWVHPTAILAGQVRVEKGASVWPLAVLRGDMGPIVVGRDSNVQDGCIAHDTGGRSETRIGPRVTVGHGAILHGCVVEGDALIGMGSILMDGCRIGPRCMVGAGSLVPKGRVVPAGSLVLGSPARVVRRLRPEEIEEIAESWRIYRDRAREMLGAKP